MLAGDRRPINTDPREQPQRQGWQPAPLAPVPPRRRNPWAWMGIGVLTLVVIFGSLVAAGALLSTTITETRTFSVGDPPALVLTNGNGSVHITGGPAGQMTVVAHKHVFRGDSSQIPITYDLSSDGKTLTVNVEDGHFGIDLFSWNIGVDFDVTVPTTANLNIKAGNGSVDARGVTGSMQLSSGNGGVSTDGGSGQVSLSAGNGSIQASGISGQLTFEAGNGSMNISNARASGTSTFHAGNGSITFSGSLDANNGSYIFDAGNGSIDLTLPADTAMQLHATIGNGSFQSDFPGVPSQDGGTLTVAVGQAPFAQVTLHSGNGSIHLHQSA